MLLCKRMITGFNTDVQVEGQVYHVQTEDRGHDNPVLESLVYIGGTIVAKKMTPYADKLSEGADEKAIAALLKRQHQLIIAAIRAGRIDELIHWYAGHPGVLDRASPANGHDVVAPAAVNGPELAANGHNIVPPAVVNRPIITGAVLETPVASAPVANGPAANGSETAAPPAAKSKRNSGSHLKRASGKLPPLPPPSPPRAAAQPADRPASLRTTSMLGSPTRPEQPPPKPAAPAPHLTTEPRHTTSTARRATGTLDLDQVINEYLKRSNEQGKLDLKVITPSIFIAGKNVGLRVQVLFNATAEAEAVVTIKIIGTAFKPQVFIGRAGRDGVANFSLALPAFTAGTAAIVIEAQSNRGRGELKHLIRRA